MTLAFILATLVTTGQVQLWHVYLLATLLGALTAIDLPAQQAFLGDLSGMGLVRRAINLNATILQISRMLGPALAGLVIAHFGAATAFWINGLSFLAVIASLIVVRANQVKTPSTESVLGGFASALRFLSGQPRLRDLITFAALLTFFGISTINIFPSVASEVLRGGPQTLGWLMGASGAGALVGTLFVVPVAQSVKRFGLVVGLAVMWMGLWFLALSLSTWLPISLLCIFLGSTAAPVVIATTLGFLQLIAPPDMRARLVSFFVMVSFGMQPLASLLVGTSAEHLGTPLAILLNGALMITGALTLLVLRPALRRWELTPQGSGPEPPGGGASPQPAEAPAGT